MVSWFSRSMGRVREGTKSHLVGTAELLNGADTLLHAMRKATDEACESMLVDHVCRTCGVVADWREHPQDIAESLAAFLSEEEAGLINISKIDDRTKPPKAIQRFDDLLSGSTKGLRALESFGDFYIVVILPRHLLRSFDEINKHWIAQPEA